MMVLQSFLLAQNHELRSLSHNDTAGSAAEFVNEVDALLNDTEIDSHDKTQAVTRLMFMKTNIEQSAPPL